MSFLLKFKVLSVYLVWSGSVFGASLDDDRKLNWNPLKPKTLQFQDCGERIDQLIAESCRYLSRNLWTF